MKLHILGLFALAFVAHQVGAVVPVTYTFETRSETSAEIAFFPYSFNATLGTLASPVTLSIDSSGSDSTVFNVCVSPLPVAANSNNFATLCAPWQYTAVTPSLPGTVYLGTVEGAAGEVMDETDYFITVLSTSSDAANWTLSLSYDVCENGGRLSSCDQAILLSSETMSSTWGKDPRYYVVDPSLISKDTGAVTFTLEQTNVDNGQLLLSLSAFLGNFPSTNYSVSWDSTSTSGNTKTYQLYEPYDLQGRVWYLAVTASGTAVAGKLSVSTTNCTTGSGPGCYVVDQALVYNSNFGGTSLPAQANGWTYWKLNTSAVTEDVFWVRVTVGSYSGPAPQLYARAGGLTPTLSSFTAIAASAASTNQLSLYIDKDESIDWVVGIYGNVDYSIWPGNCLNNCNGDGSCSCQGDSCTADTLSDFPILSSDSFGVCSCSSGSSFDCHAGDSDTFETLYIVLIAVGGAIILAVAIGVPLYCYMQNRRRNRYERV